MSIIHAGVPERPYLLRYAAFALQTFATQSAFDHRYFPTTKFSSVESQSLPIGNEVFSDDIVVNFGGVNMPLNELLTSSGTLSFLVIKDGNIDYERYFGGVDSRTPILTYSVTKSFVASLLAIACSEGLITSLDDPIGKYLPELPRFVHERTIKSLMSMETGIRYTTGKSPNTDMVKMWFYSDIRKLVRRMQPASVPSGMFLYNDMHLHLLMYLLERLVGDVSAYFNEKLWRPLQPENSAEWMMDGTRSGFLKADGGLVLTARDLARFGMLYLNGGLVDGHQVLPNEWCNRVGQLERSRTDKEYFDLYRQMEHPWYNQCFKQERTFYRNFWWNIDQGKPRNDFFAMGILGQFVYVSPSTNTVIVRQGNRWGINAWWPSILEQLASNELKVKG
ncbi:MAG TPA: serine hydrolase [Williamwhitmania sp.]|nr:serine hydrolase [Williamwhitmania sp.]